MSLKHAVIRFPTAGANRSVRALVRSLIAEVLRDEGIEVMEAGHAQAALDTLQQHAARIHVLFTDIQMPGPMDGLALAHHTSKNWPWIALLITSARSPPHRTVFPAKGRFVSNHIVTHRSCAMFASSQQPREGKSK